MAIMDLFTIAGIIKLAIIALAIVLGIYVYFFNLKTKRLLKVGADLNDAPVLLTGSGSYLGARERTGGRLVLTTKELVLLPHKVNLVKHAISVPLADMRSARPYLTWKFYPTGLAVQLKDREARFWVYQPKKWARLINEQVIKDKE
jgi:hypothetical protein